MIEHALDDEMVMIYFGCVFSVAELWNQQRKKTNEIELNTHRHEHTRTHAYIR